MSDLHTAEEQPDDTTDDTVAVWEHFSPLEYQEAVCQLVHMSAKTVNSNATAGGVRLTNEHALPLPYVSASTLLASGISISLDYLANAGKTARIAKQVRAIKMQDDFASQANPIERETVLQALEALATIPFETGFQTVDHRVRQLLLPIDLHGSDYVSITPITPSGLCDLLFHRTTGLVTKHREAVKEQKEQDGPKEKRALRQAHMNLGGSNPQNVGGLVRTMQRPLLMDAPVARPSLRAALSIYHKGIPIQFTSRDLHEYKSLLLSSVRDGRMTTSPNLRGREVAHVRRLCEQIFVRGADALDMLVLCEKELPHEHLLTDEVTESYELVSRAVDPVVRGLIDPRLREKDWPHGFATRLVAAIENVTTRVDHETVPMFTLNHDAVHSLITLVEDIVQ